MPPSQSEKIELFRKDIMSKASAERDAIMRDTEETKKQELDREQNRQLEEIYQSMQRQINDINVAGSREVSKRTRELRQTLYDYRERYLLELLTRVRADLIQFTRSPEYDTYLEDSARKLNADYPQATDVTLEVRSDDLRLADQLHAAFGNCKMRANDEQIKIGGIRLVDHARSIQVDSTLDATLESQREWFYENSHFNLE